MYLQQTDQFCFNEAYEDKIFYDGMELGDEYVVCEVKYGIFNFHLIHKLRKFVYPAIHGYKEEEYYIETFDYHKFDEIRMLDGKVYEFSRYVRYSSDQYAFLLDFLDSAKIPYIKRFSNVYKTGKVYTLVYQDNGSNCVWVEIEPKLSAKLFEDGYIVSNTLDDWIYLFSNGYIDSLICFRKLCSDIKTFVEKKHLLNPKKIDKIEKLYEKEEKELAMNTLLILLTRLMAKHTEIWKMRF